MQSKNNKTGLQALVLGIFVAMTLACASSKGITDGANRGGGDGNNSDNPTSAEVIYESVDSLANTQIPNETDMASL